MYVNETVERTLQLALPALLELQCGDACSVIDVGCGTGAFSAALRARFPTWTFKCSDPCPLMLERAEAKDLHIVEAPAESLPFADGTFDLATSVSSFHFWRDRRAGLREVARVLKPGSGLFVATDWNADYFSIRALSRWLLLAGYPAEDADVLSLPMAHDLITKAGFAVVRAESYTLVNGRMRPLGAAVPIGPRWGMFTVVATTASPPSAAEL